MCGVAITLSSRRNGCSGGSGSTVEPPNGVCPFQNGRPVGQFERNILIVIKDRDPQHIGSIASRCVAMLNSVLHVALSHGSNLCETTVDENLSPRDIATLI
jgi:hypothetical protein